MNKIKLTPTDANGLMNKYRHLVLDETKSKLIFLIGIYAVRTGKLKFNLLKNDTFSINGEVFQNNLKNVSRKTILNTLFNKPIKVDGIDYTKLTKETVFKSLYKKHNFNVDDLIFLYKKLDVILFTKLTSFKMKGVLSRLSGKFNSKLERSVFEIVFDYERYFHQKDDNKTYFGFNLAQALDTNVCVYCNREYISTISDVNGEKLISPAFDHFLSQSEYPYMAISLFNLIPSCYSCNSQLKHNKPFNINDYLYPFEDSYEGKAEFKTYWNKSFLSTEIPEAELVNVNDLKIEIKPIYTPEPKIFGDLSLPQNERKGNIKVFQTELVYDSIHRDSVLEVITQFRVHSKKDIESLKTSYTFIKNDADVYQFYFKNYLDEKDFNKRPLSRMTRDIAMQINVIYNLFI